MILISATGGGVAPGFWVPFGRCCALPFSGLSPPTTLGYISLAVIRIFM